VALLQHHPHRLDVIASESPVALRVEIAERERVGETQLDARRDWGYAGDYVEAMWMMLQQDQPDDYVIATGEEYSVQEFLERAFDHLKLEWSKYVEIDKRFFRPAEVERLIGDASKARKVLGWRPRVNFDALVTMMVESDLELAQTELRSGGQ